MRLAVKHGKDRVWVDKTFFNRFTESDLHKFGYSAVVIDDKYSDVEPEDFNNDLTFSVEKYNARKEKEKRNDYEALVVAKIRMVYTIDQELALLRQRDSKYTEFNEYNEYVEKCKAEAKKEVGYGI